MGLTSHGLQTMTTKLTAILLLLLLFTASTHAQSNRTWSFGAGIGPSFGVNESEHQSLGPYLRLYGYKFRGISDQLTPEFGLSILKNSGDNPPLGYSNYSTTMIDFDARLRFSPIELNKFLPYIYGGIGGVYWNSSLEPFNRAADSKAAGLAAAIHFGGGVSAKLNSTWSVDLSVGSSISFTDNLNQAHDDRNDGWWHAMVGMVYSLYSGSNDSDDDGLTDDQERMLGTDPYNADSDNDGLSDGDEINTYKTNPLNSDSDNDGLRDGDEIFQYHTDPLRADSDSDGLLDGDEILTFHSNPLNSDTDGDGLKDGEEAHIYHTDPTKADTDGDGLNDGEEITIYKTNPLSPDTDGDQLGDGDEVHQYKTSPTNPDTDGGSVFDGIEVKRGTNPLDASDDTKQK